MRALGFDVKKADVLKILRDYDREGTGKISFEDFNEVSKYMSKNNFHTSKGVKMRRKLLYCTPSCSINCITNRAGAPYWSFLHSRSM